MEDDRVLNHFEGTRLIGRNKLIEKSTSIEKLINIRRNTLKGKSLKLEKNKNLTRLKQVRRGLPTKQVVINEIILDRITEAPRKFPLEYSWLKINKG